MRSVAKDFSVGEQPKVGTARLVRKPIEMICCAPDQQLTFVQRRILTAVCGAVAANGSDHVVAFSPRSLDTAIGNKANNLDLLHQAAVEMRELKAWLNPLDVDTPPATHRVFDAVSSGKSEIRFSLEPFIVECIRHGDNFAEVDPDVEKHLGGSNALALYELSAFFLRCRLTPVHLPAVRWRQLLTGNSNLGQDRFVKAKLLKRPADVLAAVAGFRPILLTPSSCKRGHIGITIRRLNGRGESADCPDLDQKKATEVLGPFDSDQTGVSPDPCGTNGINAFADLFTSWNSQRNSQRDADVGGLIESGDRLRETSIDAGAEMGPIADRTATKVSAVETALVYFASQPPGAERDWSEILSRWNVVRSEVVSAEAALRRAEATERAALVGIVRALVRAHGLHSAELYGADFGQAGTVDQRTNVDLADIGSI